MSHSRRSTLAPSPVSSHSGLRVPLWRGPVSLASQAGLGHWRQRRDGAALATRLRAQVRHPPGRADGGARRSCVPSPAPADPALPQAPQPNDLREQRLPCVRWRVPAWSAQQVRLCALRPWPLGEGSGQPEGQRPSYFRRWHVVPATSDGRSRQSESVGCPRPHGPTGPALAGLAAGPTAAPHRYDAPGRTPSAVRRVPGNSVAVPGNGQPAAGETGGPEPHAHERDDAICTSADVKKRPRYRDGAAPAVRAGADLSRSALVSLWASRACAVGRKMLRTACRSVHDQGAPDAAGLARTVPGEASGLPPGTSRLAFDRAGQASGHGTRMRQWWDTSRGPARSGSTHDGVSQGCPGSVPELLLSAQERRMSRGAATGLPVRGIEARLLLPLRTVASGRCRGLLRVGGSARREPGRAFQETGDLR